MGSGKSRSPAAQLRVQLGLHGGHREDVLPAQQPDRDPLPRCTESATATARCFCSTRRAAARRRRPAGGAAPRHNTNATLAQRLAWMPAALPGSRFTPNGQVGLPGGQRLQRAAQRLVRMRSRVGGLSEKKASASSIRTAPRDDAVHRNGELRLPAGGHARTRLATASISSSRRAPSRSSSAPASVRRAWRELRSNSSTSSASSIWRTR
jgi:hypothetical protein